jgi:putative FmdB family regulatory protein
MPFYEYECKGCGHRLEVLQQLSEAPLMECPSCLAPSLRRLVSAAGFRLKGSGWYATDFKDKGLKKDAKGDAETPAKPDAKAGSDASSKDVSSDTAGKDKAAPPATAPASK